MRSWQNERSRGVRSGRARGTMLSGWAPTPPQVVTEALRLADLTANDILFDLGCGDGRVVVRAAKMFGATAIGFDIHPQRIQQSRGRARRFGVGDLVRVRRQDMLSIPDLDRATVVYLYLPQRTVNRLKPMLRKRCQEGARIVSVSTWLFNWKTEKELTMRVNGRRWYIGLWIVA
jgi:ribosomal protein L11 methylase PrmA